MTAQLLYAFDSLHFDEMERHAILSCSVCAEIFVRKIENYLVYTTASHGLVFVPHGVLARKSLTCLENFATFVADVFSAHWAETNNLKDSPRAQAENFLLRAEINTGISLLSVWPR